MPVGERRAGRDPARISHRIQLARLGAAHLLLRAGGVDWAIPASRVRCLLRNPAMEGGTLQVAGTPLAAPPLAETLGLQERPGPKTAVVLTAGLEQELAAVLVESVAGVVEVIAADVGGRRSPKVRALYPKVWGIWQGRARPVLLLDPDALTIRPQSAHTPACPH